MVKLESLSLYPHRTGVVGVDFTRLARVQTGTFATESGRTLTEVHISPSSVSLVDSDKHHPHAWKGCRLQGIFDSSTNTMTVNVKTHGKDRRDRHLDFNAKLFIGSYLLHLTENGYEVSQWDAVWPSWSTDFALYTYLIENAHEEPEQAAWDTWTGQIAFLAQFSEIVDGPSILDKGDKAKERVHTVFRSLTNPHFPSETFHVHS